MNYRLAAAGCIFAALSIGARAQEVSPSFSDGFCQGWTQAVDAEQKRFLKWAEIVIGNSTPTTAFGISLRAIVDSIPPMVLLPPITGAELTLEDGRTLVCSPTVPK